MLVDGAITPIGAVLQKNPFDLLTVCERQVNGQAEVGSEVSDFGVPSLIFGQLLCGVIVAVERCWFEGHIKTVKHLSEEENFMRGVVQGDILFGVAVKSAVCG